MRFIFLALITFIVLPVTAQTGSFAYELSSYDADEDTVYHVSLTNASYKKDYKNMTASDTITGIPVGAYDAFFFNADSTMYVKHSVEILEDTITNIFLTTNVWIEYFPFKEDSVVNSRRGREFFHITYAFGTGIPLSNEGQVINSFQYAQTLGFDHILGRSPFGIGFNYGIEYYQANYTNEVFGAPGTYIDRQCFSNLNIPLSFLASVYIKDKKLLDFGISYHFPVLARISQKDGDIKVKTRNVHNFNDVRYFAHLGYWWGFLFAEYRAVPFLKSGFDDTPQLNVGIRFNVPVDSMD